MGKQSTSLTLFGKRPKTIDYIKFNKEDKQLIDYTIQESLKINNELRVVGLVTKILKPKKNNLWLFSWSDRIELGKAFEKKDLFKVLNIAFGLDKKQFVRTELFNAFSCYKWVAKNYEQIIAAEIEQLSSELTQEEKDAGVGELQEFGYSVALDNIAHGDVLKYNDYLELPYSKIFRKLALDKKKYEITKTMQDNASRKNTRDN